MPREGRNPFCIFCERFFGSRKEAIKHFENQHSNLSTKSIFGCEYCKTTSYVNSVDLKLHEVKCKSIVADPRPRSPSLPPLPEPLETDSDDGRGRSQDEVLVTKGSYRWVAAKLCSLDAHGLSDATLAQFLEIMSEREGFLERSGVDTQTPKQLRKIRQFCELSYVDVPVQHHTAPRASGRESQVQDSLVESRKRAKIGSSQPRGWSSVSVYDLVQKHYPKWRTEIIAQRAAIVDEGYSNVMTGSVYRNSEFFQKYPEAACLALYADGATVGDMRALAFINCFDLSGIAFICVH